MKFKYILSVTTVIMLLVLTACSSDETSDDNTDTDYSDFPNDTVEMLIPYPAGGGTDLVGRTIVNHLEEHFPNESSVAVENEGGGGGVVGLTEFMKADPDGYQIALSPSSVLTVQTHQDDTPFELDTFEPILNVSTVRQYIMVSEDSEWDTFDEFLKYAEEHPGEINISTSGEGSTQHIALEMMNDSFDIDTKHVPYDGAGEAKNAVAGGHVDAVVSPFQEDDEGTLKPLGSFSDEEGENTSDVPLLVNEGLNMSIDVYHGLYVPKETPDEIKEILHDAVKDTIDDPDFQEEFDNTQAELNFIEPEEYKEKLEELYDEIGEVMEDVGLID